MRERERERKRWDGRGRKGGVVDVRFAGAVNDNHLRREGEREGAGEKIRRLLFARGRIDANGTRERDCRLSSSPAPSWIHSGYTL